MPVTPPAGPDLEPLKRGGFFVWFGLQGFKVFDLFYGLEWLEAESQEAIGCDD